jgi:predicted ABC-type sugar transport system permease subunit
VSNALVCSASVASEVTTNDAEMSLSVDTVASMLVGGASSVAGDAINFGSVSGTISMLKDNICSARSVVSLVSRIVISCECQTVTKSVQGQSAIPYLCYKRTNMLKTLEK